MTFKRIRAVGKKELRQIRRDKRTLGILFFIPTLLLILYGYALNLDVRHLSTAVLDSDRTAESRALVDRLFQAGESEYFDFVAYVEHPASLDSLMLDGKVQLALVIPTGFARDLQAGRPAQVQVVVDGIMASTASTAIGYVEAFLMDYASRIQLVEAGMRSLPVDYRPRLWYNPELRSELFLIPGLIAFILMIMTAVATTLSVVRERELGSMEQLMVSPLKPGELIIGKMVPYAVISLLSTTMVIAVSQVLFDMPVKGSYFLLFIAAFLYLCSALGMGLLISTLVKSQEVAFLVVSLATLLPTFVLSGFVFPISNMPGVVQAFTYLVPARYFLVALRGIMLKGVGLEAFGDQMLMLVGFAVLNLLAGTLRLKKIMG